LDGGIVISGNSVAKPALSRRAARRCAQPLIEPGHLIEQAEATLEDSAVLRSLMDIGFLG
jgi:hypothetical protein